MKGVDVAMDEKPPKLDELLRHLPLKRVLEIDGIAAEFALIKRAFEAEGKGVPKEDDFRRVGRGSGTHLLKLVTSRAPTGQHVLRIKLGTSNRGPGFYPSLDAKLAPAAKLVFLPLEVAGNQARSLVDHILNPDELSPKVTEAFSEVFGKASLKSLLEALTTPLEEITTLPAQEFPIIFLPRAGGGDLQVTPLAPAESYVRFRDVTEPYFRKAEEGAPGPPRGHWHKQLIADKPQNISIAVGKQRTRFFATMPQVLDQWSAEVHRFLAGGRFPRWREPSVVEAVEAYANLIEVDYSNRDIRAGLDRRADALIAAAREFIDETLTGAQQTLAETSANGGSAEIPNPPAITTVILARRWPKNGFDRARQVLISDHFKGRLKAAGEL